MEIRVTPNRARCDNPSPFSVELPFIPAVGTFLEWKGHSRTESGYVRDVAVTINQETGETLVYLNLK